MNLPEFLTQDDAGYIHLTGHRIGLVDIVAFYRDGDSAEMLHARFPTISLPLIHKVIAFVLENQAAVDADRVHEDELVAQQRAAAGPGLTLETLRQRSQARRLMPGA